MSEPGTLSQTLFGMMLLLAAQHQKPSGLRINGTKPKFQCGQLLATPAALDEVARSHENLLDLLVKHMSGDWGEVGAEDWKTNDQALQHGGRLFSAYVLRGTGTRLWCITEGVDGRGERASTTFLLPSEY